MSTEIKSRVNMPRRRNESTATQRLKQDYLRLLKDPVPYITAHPSPANILEWHYAIKGPENTPYEDGVYHGKLCFHMQYPFMPPRIYILTPNGRFRVNTKLCLSMSDFHPEKWNPAWSVSTILTGLLSFMLENARTFGDTLTTDSEKRVLAKQSWEFNLKNETFCELFPEIVEELKEKIAKQAQTKTNTSTNTEPNQSKSDSNSNSHSILWSVIKSCLLNGFAFLGLIVFFLFVKYILTVAD